MITAREIIYHDLNKFYKPELGSAKRSTVVYATKYPLVQSNIQFSLVDTTLGGFGEMFIMRSSSIVIGYVFSITLNKCNINDNKLIIGNWDSFNPSNTGKVEISYSDSALTIFESLNAKVLVVIPNRLSTFLEEKELV